MTATKDKTDLAALCADLGLSLQCSPPRPGVDNEHSAGAWPHIAYAVAILRNDREVWAGPYKLGVGRVEYRKAHKAFHDHGIQGRIFLTTDEVYCLDTCASGRTPIDRMLHASLAAKLAAFQKVAPKLADVVYSLLSDGAAFFDGQSFAQWAGDFGYDTDSRKAEETFRKCDAIGRELIRGLGRDTVEKLREAGQDY